MASDFELVTPEGSDEPKKEKKKTGVPLVYATNPVQKTPLQQIREENIAKGTLNPWAASALRGASFGLSDKAIAGVKDYFSEGDDYERFLAEEFAARDAFNAEHPVASTLTEIGGGLLTGGPVTGLVKGAGKAMLPRVAAYAGKKGIIPALTRLGAVAGGGAAAGAVAGAGQAEHGKELQGAGNGAALGALTAVGTRAALKGASKAAHTLTPIGRRIGTSVGLVDPKKWAQREFAGSLDLDGDDFQMLAKRLDDYAGEGTINPRTGEAMPARPVMAMDVAGINTKSKIKAATQPNTKAKADLDQIINQRDLDQAERVAGDIRAAIHPRVDMSNAADEIYKGARAKADPLYAQARAIGMVDDPAVTDWFNANKVRQQILRDYVKAQEDIGKPLNWKFDVDDNGNLVKVKAPTVEDLMRIKDHYGKMRQSLWDDQLGRPSSKDTVKIHGNEYGYDQITDEFKSLRDLTRAVTPDGQGGSLLAKADTISGEAAEVGKALKKGSDIIKMSTEDTKKYFNGLESDAEKEAFRMGVASKLYEEVAKSRDGKVGLHKVFGSKGMREKLDPIFEGEKAKEYFEKFFGTEYKLAESSRQLAPRVSASSGALETQAPDISMAGAAVNAGTGRFGAMVNAIQRSLGGQWAEHSPQYAEELLRLGMMGPREMGTFAGRMANQQNGALSRMTRAAGAAGRGTARGAPYSMAGVAGSHADEESVDEIMRSVLSDSEM